MNSPGAAPVRLSSLLSATSVPVVALNGRADARISSVPVVRWYGSA